VDATILLVEDDASIREITKMGLRDAGFTVHTAADGDEALNRFRHDHPDLVVLDVMLPKRDGLEDRDLSLRCDLRNDAAKSRPEGEATDGTADANRPRGRCLLDGSRGQAPHDVPLRNHGQGKHRNERDERCGRDEVPVGRRIPPKSGDGE